jgi:hypothetical protein
MERGLQLRLCVSGYYIYKYIVKNDDTPKSNLKIQKMILEYQKIRNKKSKLQLCLCPVAYINKIAASKIREIKKYAYQ